MSTENTTRGTYKPDVINPSGVAKYRHSLPQGRSFNHIDGFLCDSIDNTPLISDDGAYLTSRQNQTEFYSWTAPKGYPIASHVTQGMLDREKRGGELPKLKITTDDGDVTTEITHDATPERIDYMKKHHGGSYDPGGELPRPEQAGTFRQAIGINKASEDVYSKAEVDTLITRLEDDIKSKVYSRAEADSVSNTSIQRLENGIKSKVYNKDIIDAKLRDLEDKIACKADAHAGGSHLNPDGTKPVIGYVGDDGIEMLTGSGYKPVEAFISSDRDVYRKNDNGDWVRDGTICWQCSGQDEPTNQDGTKASHAGCWGKGCDMKGPVHNDDNTLSESTGNLIIRLNNVVKVAKGYSLVNNDGYWNFMKRPTHDEAVAQAKKSKSDDGKKWGSDRPHTHGESDLIYDLKQLAKKHTHIVVTQGPNEDTFTLNRKGDLPNTRESSDGRLAINTTGGWRDVSHFSDDGHAVYKIVKGQWMRAGNVTSLGKAGRADVEPVVIDDLYQDCVERLGEAFNKLIIPFSVEKQTGRRDHLFTLTLGEKKKTA